MAKTFYTLDEAAQVLGKSVAEVQAMVSSGELTEFKDGDQVVVKKDQVDLIAPASDSGEIGMAPDESGIGLADGLEPLSLESDGSGSGLSLEPVESDGPEASGISIFEPEDEGGVDLADAAEQTQVTDAPVFESEFAADAGSSGSGLLDLTREADDTSLGADLLDDVYGQETVGGQTAVGDSGGFGGGEVAGAAIEGGELFESTGAEAEAPAAAAPMAPVAAMAYDGAGSGLVGGLAIGVTITALMGIAVAIFTETRAYGLVEQIAGQHFIVAGVLAVVTLLLGGIGWFLGRR